MATKIQLRHDNASKWVEVNPILLPGEIGIELDTKKFKIGDGQTKWKDLQYAVSGGSGGGSGTSVEVDNNTIILNPNGTISSKAILDQNNEDTVKFWTGTLEEYEQLQEYDDNTLYNILDDDESMDSLVPIVDELVDKVKPATNEELGLVKPDGETITINEQGQISAVIPDVEVSEVNVATSDSLGIVKPDNTTISVNNDGVLSAIIPDVDLSQVAKIADIAQVGFTGNYEDLNNTPTIPEQYVLPEASTTTLGGVKVDGNTIKIVSGIISAVASGDSAWTVTHNEAENDESYVIANKDSNFKIQCGTFHIPYYVPATGTSYYTYTLPSEYSTFCMVYHKIDCYASGASNITESFAKSTTTTTFTTEALNLYSKVTVNWFAVGY